MLGKARRKALAKTKQNLSEGERENDRGEVCVWVSVWKRDRDREDGETQHISSKDFASSIPYVLHAPPVAQTFPLTKIREQHRVSGGALRPLLLLLLLPPVSLHNVDLSLYVSESYRGELVACILLHTTSYYFFWPSFLIDLNPFSFIPPLFFLFLQDSFEFDGEPQTHTCFCDLSYILSNVKEEIINWRRKKKLKNKWRNKNWKNGRKMMRRGKRFKRIFFWVLSFLFGFCDDLDCNEALQVALVVVVEQCHMQMRQARMEPKHFQTVYVSRQANDGGPAKMTSSM